MVSGASGAARSQRRNNGKGRVQSALASAHGRNGKRGVETSSAGRAGAHRPSEALHPTRSSDVLPRIARERVPTSRNGITMICETVHRGFFAEMQSIRPHSGSDSKVVFLTNVYWDSSGSSRNGRLGELKRSLIVIVLDLCCCRAGKNLG